MSQREASSPVQCSLSTALINPIVFSHLIGNGLLYLHRKKSGSIQFTLKKKIWIFRTPLSGLIQGKYNEPFPFSHLFV